MVNWTSWKTEKLSPLQGKLQQIPQLRPIQQAKQKRWKNKSFVNVNLGFFKYLYLHIKFMEELKDQVVKCVQIHCQVANWSMKLPILQLVLKYLVCDAETRALITVNEWVNSKQRILERFMIFYSKSLDLSCNRLDAQVSGMHVNLAIVCAHSNEISWFPVKRISILG